MTGGASMLSVLANAARIKVVAVLVGTGGVGVIAYLINLVQLSSSITTLGIASGMVKLTSEKVSQGEQEEIERLKVTALSTTFWFSILVTLALIAGARNISIWLTGNAEYAFYVRLISLSIPCLTLNQSLTAVLNGYKAIREISLIMVWGALIGLLLVAPLVWKYRVTGVVLHFVLQSVALLIIAALFFHRKLKGPGLPRFLTFRGFDRRLVKPLAAFGVAAFLLNVFHNLAFLVVRKLIQHSYGATGVGLYQVPYGLTLQYLNIVLTALMTYSLPTMSSLRDDSSLRIELNQTLKASMLAIVPIIGGLLVLKRVLVLLLYSRAFLPSVNLLEIQLIGDFFKVIAYVFGVAALARARLTAWLMFDLLWDAVFIGLSYTLLGRVGLVGVAIAFVGGYVSMSAGYALFAWRRMHLRLDSSILRLILLSTVALVLIAKGARFSLPVAILVAGTVLLLWGVLCFTRTEIRKGMAVLRNLSWGEEDSLSLP